MVVAMKVRQSFVTNSSSSSYIIKFNGESDELEIYIKDLTEIYNKINKECLEVPEINGHRGEYEIRPDYDLWKILEGFFDIRDNR
jgi:hypothetical protein